MYFNFLNLINYFNFSTQYYFYVLYNLKLNFILNIQYLNFKKKNLYKISKQLLYLLYIFKNNNKFHLFISKNNYIDMSYLYKNLSLSLYFNVPIFYNKTLTKQYNFLKNYNKTVYYQKNSNYNFKLKHFFIPFKKNIFISFFYYKMHFKYFNTFKLQVFK